MSIKISKPSEQLAPFVKQYWFIENHVAAGDNYSQRLIPCGLTELMFYLRDIPITSDNTKNLEARSVISGHKLDYYDLTISGHLSLFSVVFYPQGLMMFFDIPLNEIFNINASLRDLIKENLHQLETELYEAGNFSSRINIVESFLQQRIEKTDKLFNFRRINESIRIINDHLGQVDIDFLASEVCLSRKQFERVFSEFVGTSPKQFLKTVRFQSAIHRKSFSPQISLTSLAYDSGYYDQSHMTGEFKTLTGMTPRQYFKDSDIYSDYFQ